MNCGRLSQILPNCTPSFIWDKELWDPAGKQACSNNPNSTCKRRRQCPSYASLAIPTQLPCYPLHTLPLCLTWLMLAELVKLCYFSFISKALFWSAKHFLDWKKYLFICTELFEMSPNAVIFLLRHPDEASAEEFVEQQFT